MKWMFPMIVLLTGCQLFQKAAPVRHIAETPKVEVRGGDVQVSGDAQVPAKVDTKKTDTVLPIPEGSTFVFNEKLGTLTMTLAKATQMTLNRTETAIEGPKSFTPDKGATIGEEKSAQADYWTLLGLRAGVALGMAVAIFGLVRHWDLLMYGGGAVAAACLFGLFVEKHPLILIFIGLGVGACVIGPTIWHLKLKNIQPTALAQPDNTPPK